MPPPVLATPRLSLEPPCAADLDAVAALFGDPAVMAPIGGAVQTREQAWHRLLRYIGHWQALRFGHWIVRDAATRAPLGEVGLMDSRRDTAPTFQATAEAGWAFRPHAHGRGLAQEACAAMLAWADAQGMARTVCMIAPANAPSLRLADRLGYRAPAPVRYADRDVLLLERLKA